jgi:antitoxin MazE
MRAKAQKWGNSLAVRIPKSVAEEAGVGERDDLEIEVVDQVIRIRRCAETPSLAALLDRVTADNLHGEADFGERQGREAW